MNLRIRILLLPLCVAFLNACSAQAPVDNVCFGRRCIRVEIADTQAERELGLQYRHQLADNDGMLFVFTDSGRYGFWMKDTLIPLDIIWLDHNREIVHIQTDVPPCSADPCPVYQPGQDAVYVLEINAGKAKHLGLAIGRQAEFSLKDYLRP